MPGAIRTTKRPTSVVFGLEFSIVIPVSVIEAIPLWKRNGRGYVMGIIILVNGFTYGLVF